MIELEMNDVAKETIEILNLFNPKFISKISNTFLNGLKELAKDSEKIVEIDKTKKLKEQNIACKNMEWKRDNISKRIKWKVQGRFIQRKWENRGTRKHQFTRCN